MKYVYYALLLAGLIILLIRWRRVDWCLQLFLPLYVCNIVTEVLSDLYGSYFLYHINQTIGFLLLCLYYYHILRNDRFRISIWIAFGLYLVYFTAYFIRWPSHFFSYDPIDFVVEGVFVTMFSLNYLIGLYRRGSELKFSRNPHFWISSGNLLFYSGSAFFMGFAFNLFKENRTLYLELSYIVYFLNLILYSIYIKAFLCPLKGSQPN